MAKNIQTIDNPPQAGESELGTYQTSLRQKINMLGNCFSIILILLGLFLLVNGLFGIVNRGNEEVNKTVISSDNTLIDEEVGFDSTLKGSENTKQGNIDEGISTFRVKAETSSAIQKAMDTKAQIERTHKWKATNYEKGDIGIGEYEVKLGAVSYTHLTLPTTERV